MTRKLKNLLNASSLYAENGRGGLCFEGSDEKQSYLLCNYKKLTPCIDFILLYTFLTKMILKFMLLLKVICWDISKSMSLWCRYSIYFYERRVLFFRGLKKGNYSVGILVG